MTAPASDDKPRRSATAEEIRTVVAAADAAAAAAFERGTLLLRWVQRSGAFTTGLTTGVVATVVLGNLTGHLMLPAWLIPVLWAVSLIAGSVAGFVMLRSLATTAFLATRLEEQETTIIRWARRWPGR